VFGQPRDIRTDEFFRSTPWSLGLMSAGGESFATPLAFPEIGLVASSARDPVSAAFHWEAVAYEWGGRWLPDEQLFAAVTWFPVVLVGALLPLWLSFLGIPRSIGLVTTSLVMLAPAAHWWSWSPIHLLAPPLLAASALALAVVRWERRGHSLLVLALLALAGLATARSIASYVPWSMPLTTGVFVPTVARLWGVVKITRLIGSAALATSLAGMLVAALVIRTRALAVIGETVYPGARRSEGSFVGLDLLFGAPHLWILQAPPQILGTNASELSTGYLFLLPVTIVLALSIRWAGVGVVRGPALASVAVSLVFASWCVLPWPPLLAARAFPLTMAQPERIAQVSGLLATISFGLVLTAWRAAPRGSRIPAATVGAGAGFLVTLLAGRDLAGGALPELPEVAVLVVSLLVGAAVFGLIAWPAQSLALVALPVLALLVVVSANPLQRGFGDLRASRAAADLVAVDRLAVADGRWATDDPEIDAILMANGLASLSGQQWLGPEASSWRTIDPQDSMRPAWNRGASYVFFSWEPGRVRPSIVAPHDDLIVTRMDPCSSVLDSFAVKAIVSSRTLRSSCLNRAGTFYFGGQRRWIYRRVPVD
jgi:hypothetical protein